MWERALEWNWALLPIEFEPDTTCLLKEMVDFNLKRK